jgi:hypothetical protein
MTDDMAIGAEAAQQGAGQHAAVLVRDGVDGDAASAPGFAGSVGVARTVWMTSHGPDREPRPRAGASRTPYRCGWCSE